MMASILFSARDSFEFAFCWCHGWFFFEGGVGEVLGFCIGEGSNGLFKVVFLRKDVALYDS